MRNLSYRRFISALIPGICQDKVIGIPTPELRKFAKKISKTDGAGLFMSSLPHQYYEEDNLHAFLIEEIGEYQATIDALDLFLPYVDNWSTCDSMCPKVLGEHADALNPHIHRWIESEHCYTVRFGMVMLMKFCMGNWFCEEHLAWVSNVSSENYYVRMAQAWYFATALTYQYDSAIPYLTHHRLPVWVHNKTIQKAIESRRISSVVKIYLKTLKRKGN